MIVLAVGITSEQVIPPEAAWPEPVDWLVLSADGANRDLVLRAVHRNGRSGHAAASRVVPADPLRYRCVFIDLVHPVGRPRDFDSWVRAVRLHRTRLVVRGGDGDDAAERWAREAGAAAYLSGGIAPDGIVRVVAELSP
ncbi:MAG: hypothetical protein ACKO4T_09505 [Planctomycetaceae bacterium]